MDFAISKIQSGFCGTNGLLPQLIKIFYVCFHFSLFSECVWQWIERAGWYRVMVVNRTINIDNFAFIFQRKLTLKVIFWKGKNEPKHTAKYAPCGYSLLSRQHTAHSASRLYRFWFVIICNVWIHCIYRFLSISLIFISFCPFFVRLYTFLSKCDIFLLFFTRFLPFLLHSFVNVYNVASDLYKWKRIA